jgi:ribosomal-protein-alanine N-acetyltransferase
MMPPLETPRLIIRPLTADDAPEVGRVVGERRDAWLAWTVAGYDQLPALNQPPYGDRAIERRSDGRLVGLCGLVPAMGPFGQIPGLADGIADPHRFRPEVGLYWEVSPDERGQGYATEAGEALITYGFGALALGRIVAMTMHDNLASQAVMRRLGMRLAVNPEPDPEWLQVVGVALSAQGA